MLGRQGLQLAMIGPESQVLAVREVFVLVFVVAMLLWIGYEIVRRSRR